MTRTRRTDPERRERIVEAVLDVIAEHGTPGATYRSIAQAADVPLGSMTYHFPTRDDMLLAAFAHLADTMHSRFDQILTTLPPGTDPREGVVRIVVTQGDGHERDMVLVAELYALAVRDPRYRELIQHWMLRSRTSLERHFPAELAPMIDALLEGLVLHSHISTEPFDLDRVRQAVHRLVGPLPS
ncbi:TetR family transcriptional regulator C-terminal domain-containing protein [Streptomyces sp. BV286]|uniref:TetR/AcrR family transcriptional regulator n=1 Tax=Streptomyces sp. BV286 TaxID=2849672 RepID=UPI001C2E7165|nr:TetR family transcriptional regulator C-terminal domain-containing protein [Streptomyces sp. BV286]MBV1936279.1 TetR family transcriptional regulator C-terminal domain-containing protein [Streptomyces sp. BV286]